MVLVKTKYKIFDLYPNIVEKTFNRNHAHIYFDTETEEYTIIPNIRIAIDENVVDISVLVNEDIEHRPDLIAYHTEFYTTLAYWLILQHNNVIDPFRLKKGKVLELPEPERAREIIKKVIKDIK